MVSAASVASDFLKRPSGKSDGWIHKDTLLLAKICRHSLAATLERPFHSLCKDEYLRSEKERGALDYEDQGSSGRQAHTHIKAQELAECRLSCKWILGFIRLLSWQHAATNRQKKLAILYGKSNPHYFHTGSSRRTSSFLGVHLKMTLPCYFCHPLSKICRTSPELWGLSRTVFCPFAWWHKVARSATEAQRRLALPTQGSMVICHQLQTTFSNVMTSFLLCRGTE